jgi:hypothetical protein
MTDDQAIDAYNIVREKMRPNFSFSVDNFDPLITTMHDTICPDNQQQQDISQYSQTDDFNTLLANGARRHITITHRFQVYKAIRSILAQKNTASTSFLKRISEQLQDLTIPAHEIPILLALYRQEVIRTLNQTTQLWRKTPAGYPIIEAMGKGWQQERLPEVLSYGPPLLLETYWQSAQMTPEQAMNHTKTICKIPSYLAALLCLRLIDQYGEDDYGLFPHMKDNPVTPYLAEYLLWTAEDEEVTLESYVSSIKALTHLRDYRIGPLLQSSIFVQWKIQEEPRDIDDMRLTAAKSMLALDDRRGIPTLLEALTYGQDFGLSQSFLSDLESLLETSHWAKEMAYARKMFHENEPIIQNDDDEYNDNLEMYLESLITTSMIANGRPPAKSAVEGLRRKYHAQWERAYNEQLDWLRPIDLLDLTKQKKIRPIFDHIRKGRRQHATAPTHNEYGEDMAYLLTPLPKQRGETPLSIMMKEAQKQKGNPIIREYCRKENARVVAELYTLANRLKATDTHASELMLNTLLCVDRHHPFARDLRSRMKKASLHNSMR